MRNDLYAGTEVLAYEKDLLTGKILSAQKHTGKKVLSADEEFFIQSVVDRGTNVSGNMFFHAFFGMLFVMIYFLIRDWGGIISMKAILYRSIATGKDKKY